MLDYFRKKMEILLDAVLAPVWQWIMAASWRTKQLDNKLEIVAFIRSLTAPNCACWVELPEEKDAPRVTFISGWVMTALATLDTPASEDELRFALHSQSSDGSWHMFTVADE